jgi:hypothetical protein
MLVLGLTLTRTQHLAIVNNTGNRKPFAYSNLQKN